MSQIVTPELTELKSSLRTFFEGEVTSTLVRQCFESVSPIESHSALNDKLSNIGLPQAFASELDGGVGFGFQALSILAFEGGRVLTPVPIVDQSAAIFFISQRPNLRSQLLREFGEASFKEIITGAVACTFSCERSADSYRHRFVPAVNPGQYTIWWSLDGNFCLSQIIESTPVALLDRSIKYVAATTDKDKKHQVKEGEFEQLLWLELRASELAGIAQKVVSLTSEYVKTRKQFGRAIGTFQAVQHKLADMHVQGESLRSLVEFAAWSCDNSIDQAPIACRSAFMYAMRHVPIIVEAAIQLHGGIGFTWEHELHFYLRRALTIESLWNEHNSSDKLLSAVV